MHQPVTRIGRGVLGADPCNVLGEPGMPAGPTDPLGEHRGRHRRELTQQHPHRQLDLRPRRRRRRCAFIAWWCLGVDRLGHGVARQRQPPRDRSLRQVLRPIQPANLRPILHSDHSPIRRVLTFRPELPAHFSTGADIEDSARWEDALPQTTVAQWISRIELRIRPDGRSSAGSRCRTSVGISCSLTSSLDRGSFMSRHV